MVVDGNDNGGSTYLKVERRKAPRKVVPENNSSAVVLGQFGSFNPSRAYPRKKPTEKISAQLLSELESNCVVQDLSENGLRIYHNGKLTKGQIVGIFLRITWGINKESRGFTLICKVVRFTEYGGPDNMSHESGLTIINKSDAIHFSEFVASLPLLETAHS